MTSVLECSGVRRSLASGMKPRYTYMIHPSDTPYDTPRPQFRRAYWVQNCSTVDPSAQCVAPQERWNLSNLSPPCTLMSPELVLTRIWSTAPRTAGRGKCLERRGGQEEDLGGRTLGSKPYFTSLYSSATLSPLVFVWNFHRVFFVGGRDVTINLTYWSHPTIWPAVNGHSSSGRYGHSLADTIFLSLQLFPKHFDNCQNSFQLTNVFTRSTDQLFFT